MRPNTVKEAQSALVNQINELKTRRQLTDEDLRRMLGYKNTRSVRMLREKPLSASGKSILLIQQWLREARNEQKSVGYEI